MGGIIVIIQLNYPLWFYDKRRVPPEGKTRRCVRYERIWDNSLFRNTAYFSCAVFYYSTVTDFARFLGLSTSLPLLTEV